MDSRHLVLLSTCPSMDVARTIAAALVDAGAAACVNIVPGVTSIYSWQGKTHEDAELLLVIKTTADNYGRAEGIITDLHPYELPEVVAVPIVGGLNGYLEWISTQTHSDQ